MPMERGALIIRTGGRIAVSIRSSNARRHGGETADFATATLGQGMVSKGAADIGGDLARKAGMDAQITVARYPLFSEAIPPRSEVCSVNISRLHTDVADWCVHDPQ